MSAAERHAALLAAIAESRAVVEAADTPRPWRQLAALDSDNHGWVVATGSEWDDYDTTVARLPYDYDGDDAALIVRAVNLFPGVLDIAQGVAERHAPGPGMFARTACDECWPSPWPCPDLAPWLDLFGIGGES